MVPYMLPNYGKGNGLTVFLAIILTLILSLFNFLGGKRASSFFLSSAGGNHHYHILDIIPPHSLFEYHTIPYWCHTILTTTRCNALLSYGHVMPRNGSRSGEEKPHPPRHLSLPLRQLPRTKSLTFAVIPSLHLHGPCWSLS